jgi:hypothetical protein
MLLNYKLSNHRNFKLSCNKGMLKCSIFFRCLSNSVISYHINTNSLVYYVHITRFLKATSFLKTSSVSSKTINLFTFPLHKNCTSRNAYFNSVSKNFAGEKSQRLQLRSQISILHTRQALILKCLFHVKG